MNLLHSLEAILGRLLGLLRVVGIVDGGFEASSDVVGVLAGIVLTSRVEVARVENLFRSIQIGEEWNS